MRAGLSLNRQQLSALCGGTLLDVFLRVATAELMLMYGDSGFGLRVHFDRLVGYISPSLIAIGVGIVVGNIAESGSALLTLFSLFPVSFATLFLGRPRDFKEWLFVLTFTIVNIFLGMGAAALMSKRAVKPQGCQL